MRLSRIISDLSISNNDAADGSGRVV